MDNRHKPLHPSLVREAFAWIRKKANIGPTGGRRPTLHALRHYAGSPTIPGAGLEAASVKDVTSFNPA